MGGEGESTLYRQQEFDNDKELQKDNKIGIVVNESSNIEPADLMHSDCDEKLNNIHSVVPRDLIPKIGMEFETEVQAYQFYRAYAKQVGFSIRRSKSHNDKSGKLICRLLCCSAEGKRMSDKRDLCIRAHRPETRFGCEARMKVNSLETGKFQVIQFVEEHNHYLSSDKSTNVNESELDPKILSSMRYKKLCALTTPLLTRAAERSDTYKVAEDRLINILKMIDEMLEKEEFIVEKNSVLQSEKLVPGSNFDMNLSIESETNFGKGNRIRDLKTKAKPISGKRVRGSLEKISKKRKPIKKCQT